MPETAMLWMTFIYAIPISGIVVVVYASMWWGLIMRASSVSALVWGLTVCVHLTAAIPANIKNMTLIYAAAGVFQVLVILWYLYLMTKRNKLKQSENDQTENTETQINIDKGSAGGQ